MNDFTAKKLGEVLAFARAHIDTLEKGQTGFSKIFSDEEIDALMKENEKHERQILKMADKYDVTEAVETKADGTGQKLEKMRELYLADEDDWADPSELLEWSGFFHGAGYVHWSLLQGATDGVEDADLDLLTDSGYNFHKETLTVVAEAIADIARKKNA